MVSNTIISFFLYENFKYKLQATSYRIQKYPLVQDILLFVKSFRYKQVDTNFWGQFSKKFKKLLNIYLFLFSSNLLQIFLTL